MALPSAGRINSPAGSCSASRSPRAIVIEPHVLLLDEPLSNLDAKLRVEMRGEIRRLQKLLGITVLYVTHDQEEALAISDRIAVMRAGRVEQIASPRDIYERPADAVRGELRRYDEPAEWRDRRRVTAMRPRSRSRASYCESTRRARQRGRQGHPFAAAAKRSVCYRRARSRRPVVSR